MKTVYLVEMTGMAVRVCATKAQAEKYVQCMLEEIDEALGEPMYLDYEFDITEVVFDEK